MFHSAHWVLAAAGGPDTQGLANWLRDIFGPLILVIISIIAIFFLFTRELTRFMQFIVVAIAVLLIFYFPGVLESVASAMAKALGVTGSTGN